MGIEPNCYTILGRTFEEMEFDVSVLGFGFLGIFLNFGLTVVPPIVGFLGEEHITEQILLYAIFIASGVATSVAVWCTDHTGIVNGRTRDVHVHGCMDWPHDHTIAWPLVMEDRSSAKASGLSGGA